MDLFWAWRHGSVVVFIHDPPDCNTLYMSDRNTEEKFLFTENRFHEGQQVDERGRTRKGK